MKLPHSSAKRPKLREPRFFMRRDSVYHGSYDLIIEHQEYRCPKRGALVPRAWFGCGEECRPLHQVYGSRQDSQASVRPTPRERTHYLLPACTRLSQKHGLDYEGR
jgi:hypothetical protein